MKRKPALIAIMLIVAVVAGSGYAVTPGSGNDQRASIPGGIHLARPALAQTASFLDDEAGISAYTESTLPINLDGARAAFRTIERETAEWIIGSVPVTGHPEEEDPHVFVHVDGWIVAYYERGSPVGRAVHWAGHATTGPTKMEQALRVVAASAGVPVPSVGFFNFERPNATEWLLIIDNDSFDVMIPSGFSVFETSYSHFVTATNDCGGTPNRSNLTIDGVSISNQCNDGTYYGQVVLRLDVAHNVSILRSHDEISGAIINLCRGMMV